MKCSRVFDQTVKLRRGKLLRGLTVMMLCYHREMVPLVDFPFWCSLINAGEAPEWAGVTLQVFQHTQYLHGFVVRNMHQ